MNAITTDSTVSRRVCDQEFESPTAVAVDLTGLVATLAGAGLVLGIGVFHGGGGFNHRGTRNTGIYFGQVPRIAFIIVGQGPLVIRLGLGNIAVLDDGWYFGLPVWFKPRLNFCKFSSSMGAKMARLLGAIFQVLTHDYYEEHDDFRKRTRNLREITSFHSPYFIQLTKLTAY